MRIGGAMFVFASALVLCGLQARASDSLVASGHLDNGSAPADFQTRPQPLATIHNMAIPAGNGNPVHASAEPLSTRELSAVAQHFSNGLSDELYDNFQLFLYVDKAESGPWAQRMFVLQKQPDGSLVLAGDWPVSTGRERIESNTAGKELPSYTPHGYYQLDPRRMFEDYTSIQWGEPMPYAMFFQYENAGRLTGLAIHAATDDERAALGSRASAGCVRLDPQAARDLFELVRSRYGGPVPMFDTDSRTKTTNSDGTIAHNPDGSLQLADGYKVLVYIEDYGGNDLIASTQ